MQILNTASTMPPLPSTSPNIKASSNSIDTKLSELEQHEDSESHGGTENAENMDHGHMITPSYETYKSMIKDDGEALNRAYPIHTFCAYRGLRKPFITPGNAVRDGRLNVTCIPQEQSFEDCKESAGFYGKPGSLERKGCTRSNSITICSIQEKKRLKKQRDFSVSCDFSKCKGKAVMVGFYNEITGSIATTDWSPVHSARVLGVMLRNHVATTTFGRGFALLTCYGERILQVLTLPEASQKQRKGHQNRSKNLNINIILEDSLSRSHFYRALPKATSTLRDIVSDRTIPATVLDFEMIQSTASSTVLNLQRLFTAQKYIETDATRYGVEEFLGKFKNEGYTTIFQDCSCWYDEWGSTLDPRQRFGEVKDEKTRRKRWREYVEQLKQYKSLDAIDDFGMMFLTCSAYSQLNVTNTFNGRKLKKFCFYGRDYSSIFLEYVEKYTSANDVSSKPFFSYTHLYTSHESRGRRIVNDDVLLAKFFHKAAHLSNTITIFASDHGGKSGAFSAYTNQGRREVYQPLLFMIVPHQVAKKLGTKIMNSLVVNQKRLIMIEDLHHALLSLLHRRVPRTLAKSRGIFDPIPLNRTCGDMQLRSDVLCLCKGMDKSVANDSFDLMWAAEYALGTLNNKIQNQYITSLKATHAGKIANYTGQSSCQRYTGVKVMRARQLIKGDNETLQFSLYVKPFSLKTIEVFDVQVTFPLQRDNGIILSELVRVSMYNKYEGCADDGVEPKLCACDDGNHDTTVNWKDKMITEGMTSFSLTPRSLVLDKPCLIIVSRTFRTFVLNKVWQDLIITYEALNACANRTYELLVGIKNAEETRLSITGPLNVTVYPRTITFLMTVNNLWKLGVVDPAFEFRILY